MPRLCAFRGRTQARAKTLDAATVRSIDVTSPLRRFVTKYGTDTAVTSFENSEPSIESHLLLTEQASCVHVGEPRDAHSLATYLRRSSVLSSCLHLSAEGFTIRGQHWLSADSPARAKMRSMGVPIPITKQHDVIPDTCAGSG